MMRACVVAAVVARTRSTSCCSWRSLQCHDRRMINDATQTTKMPPPPTSAIATAAEGMLPSSTSVVTSTRTLMLRPPKAIVLVWRGWNSGASSSSSPILPSGSVWSSSETSPLKAPTDAPVSATASSKAATASASPPTSSRRMRYPANPGRPVTASAPRISVPSASVIRRSESTSTMVTPTKAAPGRPEPGSPTRAYSAYPTPKVAAASAGAVGGASRTGSDADAVRVRCVRRMPASRGTATGVAMETASRPMAALGVDVTARASASMSTPAAATGNVKGSCGSRSPAVGSLGSPEWTTTSSP
mmetsp:Transcript_2209/g.7323  ORF Transcript_2209/g.7323 Transcript_2209/m.7323 type:complete len:303 (-) Transcript_2209:839-1747(-)